MEICAEEIQPGDLIVIARSNTDEDGRSLMHVEEVRLRQDSVTIVGVEIWDDMFLTADPVPFGWMVEVCNV
jgi:hypothetical protein